MILNYKVSILADHVHNDFLNEQIASAWWCFSVRLQPLIRTNRCKISSHPSTPPACDPCSQGSDHMEAPRVHLQDRGIGKSMNDTELHWLKSSRHSLTPAFFLTDQPLKSKRANADGKEGVK